MEEDDQRNVFNATLILDRRGSQITAVGIDHQGTRLFVGLEDGMLEEYDVTVDENGARTSLTARKPITAKQPLLSILPATIANCLAVLTGDAALRFVHSDTLESKIIHKGPILAASISLPSSDRGEHRTLPHIAIATRVAISRSVRISVYEIVPAGGQVPTWRPLWEVVVPSSSSSSSSSSSHSSSSSSSGGGVCLAWAGASVIAGIGAQYSIAWRKKSSSSSSTNKSTAGSGAWRELVTVEENSSSSSSAEKSGTSAPPPLVVTLPRQNCALLLVGGIGLMVNAAGDPVGNPVLLQSIPRVRAIAAGDGVAAFVSEDGVRIVDPGSSKWIQGLSYGEGHRPLPGQPLRSAGGGTSSSSVVVVGGRHKVWALTPVPPPDQARDLMSKRDYEGAVKLAEGGLSRGQVWAEEAFAQAALLLMEECRFSEATAALEHCSSSVFQPSELFPLFPQHTAPWEPHAMPLHWSLHSPLEPLEDLVVHAPLLLSSTKSRGLEEIVREGKQAIVQYLFRARELSGVHQLDGIDTLLMHLLIDLDAAAEATAFSAVFPTAVRPELVADRLERVGWRHALATLWAATPDHAEPALRIWRQVVDCGSDDDDDDDDSNIIERQEAIDGATTLLTRESCCSSALVLSYIPWLLSVSPANTDHVLASRTDLEPSGVLALLSPGQESRWRYLEHVISTGIVTEDDASLHTELATSLIAAVFTAAPELQHLQGRRKEAISRHSTAPLPAGPPPTRDTSVAALVSGGRTPLPANATSAVEALRFRLRLHLERSSVVDNDHVLGVLQGSALLEESAIVHWRLRDHSAVLFLLAVVLHDVGAAVCYTAAYLPPSEHRLLLQLLMQPRQEEGSEGEEGSEEPRWEDACRVVAVLGSSLDPLDVVNAAPAKMRMPAAVALIAPLIRERVHRRRSGQMAAVLHRSQVAARAARQVAAEEGKVVIDDGRACPDCHLRLGGKVFVVVQEQQLEQQEREVMKSKNDGRVSEGMEVDGARHQVTTSAASSSKILCLSCWNKRTARRGMSTL